jgi:hypothetical protein
MDTSEETLSDLTCEAVYQRDGMKCWMCEDPRHTKITHLINAEALNTFDMYQDNGTIPKYIDDPSHPDGLLPLCYNYLAGYDKEFPDYF